MFVGASAGSSADRIARDFTACLARHLDATSLARHEVTVANHPGNAGYDMLAALADAPPTGAAIGWIVTPTLAARMIDRDNPELANRMQLLGQIEREPIAFVSRADDPAENVQDIIRRASDDADAVPLATPPAGSPPHLAALRLQSMAQTRLNIVTFPSSPAARQALLAGNVSAAALGLSEVIEPVLDGSLSALGITAHRRFGLLPDTPVLDEGGIPLKAFIRRGIGVPAGTQADVSAALVQAMRSAAQDEDFRNKAEKSGYYLAWADGAAWRKQLETDAADLRRLWQTDPWLASGSG